MKISQILRSKGYKTITANPDISLEEAAKVLHQRRIGAVMVVDDKRHLIGILSERDIVRQIAEKGVSALNEPVASAMTRKVVTITPEHTVDQAFEDMTFYRFRHLPVVENERLCGIVSIGDLVKARIERQEHDMEQMRAYIINGYGIIA